MVGKGGRGEGGKGGRGEGGGGKGEGEGGEGRGGEGGNYRNWRPVNCQWGTIKRILQSLTGRLGNQLNFIVEQSNSCDPPPSPFTPTPTVNEYWPVLDGQRERERGTERERANFKLEQLRYTQM